MQLFQLHLHVLPHFQVQGGKRLGTPMDVYNEPANSFVADFIGASNILNAEMIEDELVLSSSREYQKVSRPIPLLRRH